MKTKIYLLAASLIVIMFVFGLTACGGGGGTPVSTDTTNDTTNTTETTTEDETPTPRTPTSGAWSYTEGNTTIVGIISPNLNDTGFSQQGTFVTFESGVLSSVHRVSGDDIGVDGVVTGSIKEYGDAGSYQDVDYDATFAVVNDELNVNAPNMGVDVDFAYLAVYDTPTAIDTLDGSWQDGSTVLMVNASGELSTDGSTVCGVISVPNADFAYYRVEGFTCGGLVKNHGGDAFFYDNQLYMAVTPNTDIDGDVILLALTKN